MAVIDVDLVERAIAGDRAAVRVLVDAVTPIIQVRAARTLLRMRSKAGVRSVRQEIEDLTQTVFVSLFSDGGRILKQWDPKRGAIHAFVSVVTEREIISIMRNRNKNPWTEAPTLFDDDEDMDRSTDVATGPEVRTSSREVLAALVEQVRAKLTPKGLELFYWLLVEERSIEEVVSMTGMTVDAVYAWRSRLGRLVRTLASEMMSENEGSTRSHVQRPA